MGKDWQAGWLWVAFATVCVTGCGGSSDTQTPPTASIASRADVSNTAPGKAASVPAVPAAGSPLAAAPALPKKNLFPQVLIKTSAGDIRVRLNADKAPVTVENFLESYVARGFYSGTVFHHVDKGFLVIGGGYNADGMAKESRAPIRNEAYNGLKNRRGTIAMARDPEFADSATSQFFINLVDNPSLDYAESESNGRFGYCVFGEVVEGMDVVDRMANVEVRESDRFAKMPVEPLLIHAIDLLP